MWALRSSTWTTVLPCGYQSVYEGVLGGRVADQAALSNLEGVVRLQSLLGLEGQHHRRGQPVGQREHLLAGMTGAGADEQRDRPGAVEQRRRLLQRGRVRYDRTPVGDEVGDLVGRVEAGNVAGQGEHGHPECPQGALNGLLEEPGQLLGTGHSPAERRHVGEHGVVVDLLEEV